MQKLFFLNKVLFKSFVHIVNILLAVLAFDETLNVLFQFIDMNCIFLLSSLVLFHHVVSCCQGPLVLINGIFQQTDLLGYVSYHSIFLSHKCFELFILSQKSVYL